MPAFNGSHASSAPDSARAGLDASGAPQDLDERVTQPGYGAGHELAHSRH